MTNTLNINYSALNDPSRLCVVWYKFRHGNESVISWAEFLKMWKTETRRCFIRSVGVFSSLLLAVKVQKSNHHHWDQSGNYCHPPHASHSKTWSSPSHPHNQQDHCKCKLSLVTALLLARHHSRSPFFSMIVKSFFPRGLPQHWFLSFVACSNGAAVDDEFRAYCTSLLIRVSFQLWWVVASPLPPQPPQASAARVATRYPAPSFPSLPPALGAPPARGGTERRTTRAHV